MGFFRKNTKPADNQQEVEDRLQLSEEKLTFLSRTIQTTLGFLRDFTLDLKEIQSEKFKRELEEYSKAFLSKQETKKLSAAYDKQKKTIGDYIKQQNNYLRDREKEYRDTIDLLTRALASFREENEGYNRRIYEQSEKIEKITFLDDIKQIRTALKQEVDQIRGAIKEKQALDQRKIEQLSKQVKSLELELKQAAQASLRDGFTGLYNREGFERYLNKIIERNVTEASPFCLLLVEIDNYDKVEATYGERIARRVILAIGEECRKCAGTDGFLARFEESVFSWALPGESPRGALRLADALCRTVNQTRYAVSDVQDGHVLSFTVSIGVSAYRRGDTSEMVLARAQEAVAKAKEMGQNRVVGEKVFLGPTLSAIFRGRWFRSGGGR